MPCLTGLRDPIQLHRWEVHTHANSKRSEKSFIHQTKRFFIQTNSGVLLGAYLAKSNSLYLKMWLIEKNIHLAPCKN